MKPKPIQMADEVPTELPLTTDNTAYWMARALDAERELAVARDALREQQVELAMMQQRFTDRAAWCLMGAPNEWMRGEATAHARAALDVARLLEVSP